MCVKWAKCLWVSDRFCKHPHPQKDFSCFDAKGCAKSLMKHDTARLRKVKGVYKN